MRAMVSYMHSTKTSKKSLTIWQKLKLACWRSFSSGTILLKHFRISWYSSGEIEDESHGRNLAIIFTGILHKNRQSRDACSSGENFPISKGKTWNKPRELIKEYCFNAENLNNSHEDSNISFLLFTAHPRYGSSSVNELPQYLGTDENSTNWNITCSSSFAMCWLIDVRRALVQDANSLGNLSSSFL